MTHCVSGTCGAWWWRQRAFWCHGAHLDRAIPVLSSFSTTYFEMKGIRKRISYDFQVRKSWCGANSSEIHNLFKKSTSEGSFESFSYSKAETLELFGPAWFFDYKARFQKLASPTFSWILQSSLASFKISCSSEFYLHLESLRQVLKPWRDCYCPAYVFFNWMRCPCYSLKEAIDSVWDCSYSIKKEQKGWSIRHSWYLRA